MDFTYLFRALWRGKWIIISSVVLAFFAAFFLTMGYEQKFKSTAQLSTGFTVSEEMKLADERFNVQQIDVKFNNAIENINSPRVKSLVSYRLMLHDLQSGSPFKVLSDKEKSSSIYKAVDKQRAALILKSKLDSIQILSPANPEEKQLLKYLELHMYDVASISKDLQVARYQRSDYINIVCLTENPFLSAFIVNAICEEFKRFYGIDQKERTGGSILGIDSLVKQKKEILDQKIAAKNEFMSDKGVVDVNLEGSSNLAQISTFESSLIDQRALQKNYAYRVQQLDQLIKEAQAKGLTVIKDPAATAKATVNNSEYLRLRQEYRDLYAEYVKKGSNDPQMKTRLDNISSRMSSLSFGESQQTTEADGTISVDNLIQRKIDAEGELRASEQKIASLTSKIGQLKGGLRGMAAKGADIGQLDKEIEMASAEYKEANNRLNLAMNLDSDLGKSSFRQTIMGEPALRPEPSKRLIIIVISTLAAFFISTLTLMALAFFDKSIKTPSNFQRQTDIPLLGVVNFVKFREANIVERITDFDERHERDNIFKELMRKLRYEIESSRSKIFLFTSTNPQQGKTSLIQAIAYSLSLGKKKVLILDTNFCNNDLTIANGADQVLEKFELNEGAFDKKEFKKFVTETPVEGVDIIGCKGGDYTPSEILPKNHLLNYLNYIKEEYDFIFMEGAPLNGYTDTKELLEYADKVILIYSAQAQLSPVDKESIEFLQESDKFFGAILNKVEEGNMTM